MAEPFRPDYPANEYRVDPIYARMTLPRNTNDDRASLPSVRELFGELSVTSQFKVSLHLGDTYPTVTSDSDINAWLVTCGVLGGSLRNSGSYLSSLRYEFMCNETFLPGASFSMIEETGSRQGMVERFPNRRDFPDVTMTFYVDAEYGIIRLFEEWMNFINPLYTTKGRLTSGNPRGAVGQFDDEQFFRFRYPNTYKRNISITKFERDMFINPNNNRNVERTPSMLTYKFLNAFPTNLTALPVTYEGSTITKTTVSFNYDRYVILNHFGTGQNEYGNPNTTSDGEQTVLANPTVSWSNNNTNTTFSNPTFGVNSGIDVSASLKPL
jgi:hypothetical protein